MTTESHDDSKRGQPLGLGLGEGLGQLVEAAEKYAGNYHDDHRQDIRCDVLNAFYAGAKYAVAAERERCADICDGVASVCADTSDGARKSASMSAAQSCARLIRGPELGR